MNASEIFSPEVHLDFARQLGHLGTMDELGNPRGVKHGFVVELYMAGFEQRSINSLHKVL